MAKMWRRLPAKTRLCRVDEQAMHMCDKSSSNGLKFCDFSRSSFFLESVLSKVGVLRDSHNRFFNTV
jgi:hypothetical protein